MDEGSEGQLDNFLRGALCRIGPFRDVNRIPEAFQEYLAIALSLRGFWPAHPFAEASSETVERLTLSVHLVYSRSLESI